MACRLLLLHLSSMMHVCLVLQAQAIVDDSRFGACKGMGLVLVFDLRILNYDSIAGDDKLGVPGASTSLILVSSVSRIIARLEHGSELLLLVGT